MDRASAPFASGRPLLKQHVPVEGGGMPTLASTFQFGSMTGCRSMWRAVVGLLVLASGFVRTLPAQDYLNGDLERASAIREPCAMGVASISAAARPSRCDVSGVWERRGRALSSFGGRGAAPTAWPERIRFARARGRWHRWAPYRCHPSRTRRRRQHFPESCSPCDRSELGRQQDSASVALPPATLPIGGPCRCVCRSPPRHVECGLSSAGGEWRYGR